MYCASKSLNLVFTAMSWPAQHRSAVPELLNRHSRLGEGALVCLGFRLCVLVGAEKRGKEFGSVGIPMTSSPAREHRRKEAGAMVGVRTGQGQVGPGLGQKAEAWSNFLGEKCSWAGPVRM